MRDTYYERKIARARPYLGPAAMVVEQCAKTHDIGMITAFMNDLATREDFHTAGVIQDALEIALGRLVAAQIPDPMILDTFTANPLVKLFGSYIQDEQGRTSIPRNLYHVLRHEKAGNRIYELSRGLAQQLHDTELRGIVGRDLTLPYEAISLKVPPDIGLTIRLDDDLTIEPNEIMVAEEATEAFYGSVNVPARLWHMSLIGTPVQDAKRYRSGMFLFTIPLLEEMPLTKSLAIVERPGDRARTTEGWRDAFKLLMNAMIYATWPEGEHREIWVNKQARQLRDRLQKLPRGPKRDRVRDELAKLDPQRRTVLGEHVIYLNRDEAAGEGAETGTGRPLTVRVRVQGHWRRQPYGPKRELRRTQWIQPFWRGPEDGVMSEAVHRLGPR